ncbi:Calmodulin-binding transcription activator 3 [Hordeum vulgare]|nr:Calmodulin-binding transcription activator 3 [Hordeum vulgare]
MAGRGSESFTSGSINHELISRGPEEEMVVCPALRRSCEAASLPQRGDSHRWDSIASAQPVSGSGIASSPEDMRSAWRLNAVADAQPLRWRVGDAPWHPQTQTWRNVPAV